MFARLATVALVASSFLLGAVAKPIAVPAPAPTPAPILVERDLGQAISQALGDVTSLFNKATGKAGEFATIVTSVGGQVETFVAQIGSSSYYQLAPTGAPNATVTTVNGQTLTVVKQPSTNSTGAASSLHSVGMPFTVSFVSSLLAVSLGAQFVV